MKNISKIIILDFEEGNIYISDYDNNIYDEFEDFLVDFNKYNNLNLSSSNCEWMMTTDNSLNIKIL